MGISQKAVDYVLNYVSQTFPYWMEWYLTLSDDHKRQLQIRMTKEADNFIELGMWEYQEQIVYQNTHAERFYAHEIAKYDAEGEEARHATLRALKAEYGLDALKRLEMKK